MSLWGISVESTNAAARAVVMAAALHRTIAAGSTTNNASIGGSDGTRRRAFHRSPAGKTVTRHMHLDLIAPDLDSHAKRLLALGAQVVNEVTRRHARWTTFGDVEGNEYDLITSYVRTVCLGGGSA